MIGIITLTSVFWYNYGGVLQNYALTETLRRENYDVKAIRCNSYSFASIAEVKIYNRFKVIFDRNKKCIYRPNVQLISKNANFKQFIDEYIDPICYSRYCKATYNKINNKFDKVIVGSDQVWNPFWAVNSKTATTFFLSFLPKEKRISYSASFGVDNIPENSKELFKNSLTDFKSISVREQAGAEIVTDLTGRDVEVTLDPTLLLTADDWRAVSKRSNGRKEKPYILKYFLGEQSTERKAKIEKVAKEQNLEIYDITDVSNPNIYVSGPQEFIDLIDNAVLVCTDSFHATVFSILLNIPFWVMDREQEGMTNMGSRIVTLLNMLHLEDRLPGRVQEDKLFECDYREAYLIIEQEKIKAREYIHSALK